MSFSLFLPLHGKFKVPGRIKSDEEQCSAKATTVGAKAEEVRGSEIQYFPERAILCGPRDFKLLKTFELDSMEYGGPCYRV